VFLLVSAKIVNKEEVSTKKGLNMKLRNLGLGVGVMVLALSLTAGASTSDQGITRIQKQVRHELNMLPYVNVFDYMTFSVDENGIVTLNGEVTSPVLKSDAANVVKRIEGVERVDNQIKVLPVSFFDNGLRLRLYRTIYSGPLQRYGLGVYKPIRIIVENGHVTLVGVVDSEMDKNIAGIRANTVPGIFSVDNQLKVIKG
jgi:hyperosmotically inducible protein